MAGEIMHSYRPPMPEQGSSVVPQTPAIAEQSAASKVTLRHIRNTFLDPVPFVQAKRQVDWLHLGEGELYAAEQIRDVFRDAEASKAYTLHAEGMPVESALSDKGPSQVDLITGHMEGLNGSTVDKVRSFYEKLNYGGVAVFTFPQDDKLFHFSS